uniref:Uncharacterized protein n=1 Tax=Lutzomyia longipalpis TaxID=7200 RepID=A0A1B0CS12_LUTLO
MKPFIACCSSLFFLLWTASSCCSQENLSSIVIPSKLSNFEKFSEDIPEIMSVVKSIVIGIDGDYYDSADLLDELVHVQRKQDVLVYYFSWILDEEELCFKQWRDEVVKEISVTKHRRRKRWLRDIHGNREEFLSTFMTSWFRNSNTGYIFAVSPEMLANVVDCFVEPTGIYLVLIDAPANEEILEVVRENLLVAWKIERSYQVFVMLQNETFALHPFLRDPQHNNSYGTLMNFRKRPRDVLRNLHGYPLRIDMFHSAFNYLRRNKKTGEISFVGADAEVMRALKDFFNFSENLQQPDDDAFGYKLPNGSFTGTLGRLSAHRCDIALTGFFVKDYLNPDMEFTVPVYLDELCCVVQKSKQIPKYWLPLLCFKKHVWFCLLLSIFLSTVCREFIRCCEFRMIPDPVAFYHRLNLPQSVLKNPKFITRMWHLFVDSTIILVSSPLRRCTRVTSERIFLSSILILSLVVVAIFQSNLSTVFTHPIYYQDITTLQLKITVKYKAMLDDLFPPEASEISEHLRHRIKIINLTSIPLIETVMKDPTLATVTRKSTVLLENAKYFQTGEVFLVPECPKMYNLAYVMPKNSVFQRKFNRVLLFLTRGGFLEKWIGDMNHNTTWLNRKKLGYTEEQKFRIFNLEDMQLPFYVLLIGCTFSFAVLLCEVYFNRKHRRSELLRSFNE